MICLNVTYTSVVQQMYSAFIMSALSHPIFSLYSYITDNVGNYWPSIHFSMTCFSHGSFLYSSMKCLWISITLI